ncbi:MAG: tetratricopeptide repeat protein [Bacteroidales bacterium]|nr:tetratricopeptide repeat protein [Bacteroidales bacterium]
MGKTEKKYQRIESLVLDGRLKEAFNDLKELVSVTAAGELMAQYESLDNDYRNLLKYAIEGADDPARERIYLKIQRTALELSDITLQRALMITSSNRTMGYKRILEKKVVGIKTEIEEKLEDLSLDHELAGMLGHVRQSDDDLSFRQRTLLKGIFESIWLSDKISGSDVEMVRRILASGNFVWPEKCIVVSALSLSLLRCFDVKKLFLLADIYIEGHIQVSQRALTGLVFGLMAYSERLRLYEDVTGRLNILTEQPGFLKNVQTIIIQWLKSKETEKIKRKLEDEILPEVARFQPRLQEKLDLENIVPEELFEDKNPNWERFFEDSPDLLDKLQEFSQLQMEGSDVFMSAFSKLKHFDFFSEMMNWFMPFYQENPEMKKIFKEEKQTFDVDRFMELLSKSFYMCNSDKYSFCLNLQSIPESQKTMMMNMFNAEMEGLTEIAEEDELLNKPALINSIYSQYFHDLYRFYKLHPQREEFRDVFTLNLGFVREAALDNLFGNMESLRNIAEFLFEKHYFDEALGVYIALFNKGDSSLETFEKIGYCHHRLQHYAEAVKWYSKAELYDSNRAWNIKKIALCHRNLRNYDEALRFYLEAEKMEPENLYIKTFIGHTYLDSGDYENALKYYYQVELLSPGNKKVLRPVGWCLFLLGKFEESEKYFTKLLDEDPNKYDFMNFGHVLLCLGKPDESVKIYLQSLKYSKGDIAWFDSSFDEDSKHLRQHGIGASLLRYLKDYIRYLAE